jgi:serine/threonine-protein kinase
MMPDGTQPVPLGSGTVTKLLGEGGMSNVYEIWNGQLETYHAVKLINPQYSKDSIERFQTEIKITAKLHHPNITEIYSVGEWNGLPYIEMEKLDGVTLDKLLSERGALPIAVCTAVGIMIGRALQHAHQHTYALYGKQYHGIIHRDLKPGNIMLCFDGRVKLMDFGIARPAEASFHTVSGAVLGTLQYLSPEQLNGANLDFRTDLYSLAVTLYEGLTGSQAFPEHNMHKLLVDKSNNRYKPLTEFSRKLPRRLRRLIMRCMLHDPGRRLADVGLLVEELERIHRELTGESPEQVVRAYLSRQAEAKLVLHQRRRLPLDWLALVAAGVIFTVVGIKLVVPQYFGSRHGPSSAPIGPAAAVQPSPESAEPTVAPAPVVEAPAPVATVGPRPAAGVRKAAAMTAKSVTPKPVAQPPASVASDVAPQRGSPAAPASFLEELKARYATDDLVEIMAGECAARNFDAALKLFASLTPTQMRSSKALICKLRALIGSRDQAALAQFLNATQLNDGEFHLARARLAYDRQDLPGARQYLQASLKVPCELLDYDKLRQEVYYYEALCATRQFDADPSADNWSGASGAWYRLKSEMRANREHAYYQRAESELKRISDKYHNTNG